MKHLQALKACFFLSFPLYWARTLLFSSLRMTLRLPHVFAGVGAVALLGWLAFGYFGVQALFTTTMVNDVVPEALPLPPSIAPEGATSTSTMLTPQRLEGSFVQGDSTYTIAGSARVLQTANGRLLALENFSVTNGPDLFVYAVQSSSTANTDVKTTVREGTFVELAPLKGNMGTQTYQLPDTLDLTAMPVISIWCKRFGRNFGSAQLLPKN